MNRIEAQLQRLTEEFQQEKERRQQQGNHCTRRLVKFVSLEENNNGESENKALKGQIIPPGEQRHQKCPLRKGGCRQRRVIILGEKPDSIEEKKVEVEVEEKNLEVLTKKAEEEKNTAEAVGRIAPTPTSGNHESESKAEKVIIPEEKAEVAQPNEEALENEVSFVSLQPEGHNDVVISTGESEEKAAEPAQPEPVKVQEEQAKEFNIPLRFRACVDILCNMGLTDVEKNVNALRTGNGSIEQALSILFGEQH